MLTGLVACGGPVKQPRATHPLTHQAPSASASAALLPPPDPLVSFDAIAADSLEQWPGTREAGRQEGLAKDLQVTLSAQQDTCVRAFVRATAIVEAKLSKANDSTSASSAPAGQHETVLAEAKGDTIALGAKGPVCVRKGDVIVVSVQGDARARVILRQSP